MVLTRVMVLARVMVLVNVMLLARFLVLACVTVLTFVMVLSCVIMLTCVWCLPVMDADVGHTARESEECARRTKSNDKQAQRATSYKSSPRWALDFYDDIM